MLKAYQVQYHIIHVSIKRRRIRSEAISAAIWSVTLSRRPSCSLPSAWSALGCNADREVRLAFRPADIIQEGAAIELIIDCLNLLGRVNNKEVDSSNGKRGGV